MAFHVMFLFIWLATAMDYNDFLVARTKLCRLLLQSRDEEKWLPRSLSDEFSIRMLDSKWTVCCFQFKVNTYWKQHTAYQRLTF